MPETAVVSQPEAFPQRLERVHQETGVRVPGFIANLPTFTPQQTQAVAEKLNLLRDNHVFQSSTPNMSQSRKERMMQWKGLQFVRQHRYSPEQVLQLEQYDPPPSLNKRELFELFLNPPWNREEVLEAERQRILARNADILRLETDLLRKRGVEVPDLESLLDYCAWLLEYQQVNQRYQTYGWSFRQTPDMIYWDMMKHYSIIFQAISKTYDPLGDFEAYTTGDLTYSDLLQKWELMNMGEEDITYFSMAKKWGGGAKEKSGDPTDAGQLLTHTTGIKQLNSILAKNVMNSRVCFSQGRVVTSAGSLGLEDMTLFFDLRELRRIYSLRRVIEAEFEKELRCYESIDPRLALACIPVLDASYTDYHGSGQGNTAMGEEKITRWSEQYYQNGGMLTETEIADFRQGLKWVGKKVDVTYRDYRGFMEAR